MFLPNLFRSQCSGGKLMSLQFIDILVICTRYILALNSVKEIKLVGCVLRPIDRMVI